MISYFRVPDALGGAGQVAVTVSSADVGDAAAAAGRCGSSCDNTRTLHEQSGASQQLGTGSSLNRRLTCEGVGRGGAGGGAGRAHHAGVAAAADAADAARAGAAVAAPLPALPGAAGALPRAVLADVAAHLEEGQTKNP